MPKLRQVPEEGLGFGPRRLDLRIDSGLHPGGGRFGYVLSLDSKGQTRDLHWELTATLTRVDSRGRPVGDPRIARRELRSLSSSRAMEQVFTVDRRGIYSITVEFDDGAGRRLGRFSNYIRVVPVRPRARLLANRSSVRPGGSIFARIENVGTTGIRFGDEYAVERLLSDEWMLAPESPRGPWPRRLGVLLAGGVARCFGFGIPATMPPGRYRLSKRTGGIPREGAHRLLTAEFTVLP